MAMKIRLARGGSKKRPHYSIVAADSRSARDGRFIEKLGTYDPLLPKDNEGRVKIDLERVQYWLGQGAQATDRVQRFLEAAGVRPRRRRAPTRRRASPARPRSSAPRPAPTRPPRPPRRRPSNRPWRAPDRGDFRRARRRGAGGAGWLTPASPASAPSPAASGSTARCG